MNPFVNWLNQSVCFNGCGNIFLNTTVKNSQCLIDIYLIASDCCI